MADEKKKQDDDANEDDDTGEQAPVTADSTAPPGTDPGQTQGSDDEGGK